MKTIEIEDDIYAYLVSRTMEIGETASDILRRELKLTRRASVAPPQPASISADAPQVTDAHGFATFLTQPGFRFGNATDRFLAILSEAHRRKPDQFEKVLTIRGRDRIYFARSKEEIVKSGRSTQPLQIPKTTYWAMTNSPTRQKQDLVRQVLDVLGFSVEEQVAAARAIGQ